MVGQFHGFAFLRGRGRLLAPVALLCWCACRVLGAEARLVLDREMIEAGETVGMQVVVEGLQRTGTPVLPEIPGVRTRYLGPSSQMENINGQTTVRVVHRYMLATDGTNDVVIPSIPVRIPNQTLQTQPVRLRVMPREGHDEPVWLKLVLDRDEVVVGDTFPVELHLYFQSIRNPSAPRFDLDGFVIGRSAQPTQATTQRGNAMWSLVIWKFAVTATKPGELEVGPAEIDLTLLLPSAAPRRPGSMMDDFFGPPREARQVTVKSPVRRLRAIAPPSVGRPAGFAGAVGRFRMAANASPLQLTVGDPATVRLTVEGSGGIERLEIEPWAEDPSYRVYPGTNGFEASDVLGLSGRKAIEFVLVPERPGTLRVPIPPLVYFDPETRRYEEARASDLEFQVRPSSAGSVASGGTNSVSGAGAGGTNDVGMAAAPGVEWRPGAARPVLLGEGWGASPWVAGVLALPWVAWGGLAVVAGIRRRRALRPVGPARDLWRAEYEQLAKAIEGGRTTSLADLSRAVRCWVGWRLDRTPDGITSGTIEERLRAVGVDPELCDRLVAWFAEYDSARFAGGPQGDGGGLVGQTVTLIQALREKGEEP